MCIIGRKTILELACDITRIKDRDVDQTRTNDDGYLVRTNYLIFTCILRSTMCVPRNIGLMTNDLHRNFTCEPKKSIQKNFRGKCINLTYYFYMSHFFIICQHYSLCQIPVKYPKSAHPPSKNTRIHINFFKKRFQS